MGLNEIPDDLFEKLIRNACSAEEADKIISMLADANQQSIYDDLILAQLTKKADLDELPENVRTNLNVRFGLIIAENAVAETPVITPKLYSRKWFRYAAVAASVVAVSSFLFLFNQHNSNQKQLAVTKTKPADIAPGKDDAILTLADGRKILLSETANGQLAEQSGLSITKTADGKIVYHISGSKTGAANSGSLYNTISTPRGGQYQVNLPDGTKVWLNSASSIKFPTAFAATANRSVVLTGEAYFEVTKDKKRPFIVTTAKQSVEVLGTHFDISSYADDASTKTTLLEGSVRVTADHKSLLLKPGQQAEVDEQMSVSNVDPETAIAWKNGYFSFDDEELGSAMNKVARWYDLEVEFTDAALRHKLIAAYSTRFANVSELLKRLNQVGSAQFDLEGRTIKISRRK